MRTYEKAAVGIVLVLVGVAVGAGITQLDAPDSTGETTPGVGTATPGEQALNPTLPGSENDTTNVAQFESEQAFARYVQQGQRLAQQGTSFTVRRRVARTVGEPTVARPAVEDDRGQPRAVADSADGGGDTSDGSGGSATPPDRVSDTNIQEKGLDEPDILKTDGQYVYYAPDRSGRYRWDEQTDSETHVLSAADPGSPVVKTSVEDAGTLLRTDDRLVVIEDEELVGYDVTDPEDPEQVWQKPLNDSVVTARLFDGTIYLVTQSQVSLRNPCPVRPMGDDVEVSCTDVYRPDRQVPVDATYSAITVDPDDGSVGDATSFVGTRDRTAVYMSENGLYVTYTEQANRGELRIDFLLEEQGDELPGWVETRLTEIKGYNISTQSKEQEANRVLERWFRTLDDEEQRETRESIRNEYRSYLSDNQRKLLRTGIVRVTTDTDNLSVETVGTVPGKPLNQFSLDEHEGTLRITTTIPAAGTAQSRNDLYTLDAETLTRRGAATDMGINERVYSVRYVGDTAYVVTFRRIDPFHVVDLSDPDDPETVGELKLPGFSSYLHPIDEDHVLGIGKENGKVKAVLFDVSDPSDPMVDDDYIVNSRWSAIDDSHHAFLLDRDHGVFFLPTGDGGRVIDYTDDDLSLETSVDTDGAALRAMYINDYMYVFGSDEVAIVDENTWDRTDTVSLD